MHSLKLILSNLRYFSPAWIFASLNIIIGTWVLYLVWIKEQFQITDGDLGVILFSYSLGSIAAVVITPIITKKKGVGKTAVASICLFAASFNLPFLANSFPLLCTVLFVTGMFSGSADISMNALVSVIEREDNKPIMSANHGFFSLGGVIGAGFGSILLVHLDNPSLHMAIITSAIIMMNLWLSQNYLHIIEPLEEKEKSSISISAIKTLLGLALIAFLIMFSEGAVEHWSNIYMNDIIKAPESQIGLGFIAFSACMTIGRFWGDTLSSSFGSITIIMFGSILGVISYLTILSGSMIAAVIGFGILGLGLSVVVPEIFRLAGNMPGVQPSLGLSIVSGIGFTGFLIGPVVLGLVSDYYGLEACYELLLILLLISAVLTAFSLRKKGYLNNR